MSNSVILELQPYCGTVTESSDETRVYSKDQLNSVILELQPYCGTITEFFYKVTIFTPETS